MKRAAGVRLKPKPIHTGRHTWMTKSLQLQMPWSCCLMNQIALRAAIEEVSTWIRQRGSVMIHDNAMVALQALDTNADAINLAIENLRS